MGVDIISLPFSEQGHDDLELIRCSSGDGWVFAMTPSDLPTPALIDAVRAIINSPQGLDVGAIDVPVLHFSFGASIPGADWSLSSAPKVYHPHRYTPSRDVHAVIDRSATNTVSIPYRDGVFVAHVTHSSPPSFIRSHSSYISAHVSQYSPRHSISTARRALSPFRRSRLRNLFNRNPRYLIQLSAWRFYWSGVLMSALYQQHGLTTDICGGDLLDRLFMEYWK